LSLRIIVKKMTRKTSANPYEYSGEARFRQAMLSAPFPLMLYAEDGEVILLSKAWTDLSGYSRQDLPTVDAWLKKAMGERTSSTLSYVDKVHASDKTVEDGDYTVITKSGEKRVWYFNSAPVDRLPDGRRAIVSIATDITDRKLAEKSIQETLWLLHMIIYKTGDGVSISDANGHFEIYNSRMQEITGYSIDEANSSGDFSRLIYPDPKDRKIALQRLSGLVEGRTFGEIETVIISKDGSKKTLLVMSSVIRYKNREMFLSIYRDITERRLAEKAIEDQERFLSSVFSSLQDGISVLDKEMNIIRVNPAMEKWYSHAMPLVGKKCYEAYHQKGKRCEMCPTHDTLKTGKSAYETVPRVGSNGEITGWLDLYSYPLIDADTGKLTGVIEYVRDITERKNAEEALKAAYEKVSKASEDMKSLYKALELKNLELQKLDKMKNEFIETVSHEIRTPLSITKEGIDLVLDGLTGQINDKQADILQTARVNMSRLSRIITNLLDVSKMEAGRLEIKKMQVDIASLAAHVSTLFEIKVKETGLELRMELPKEPVLIMADADMIIQVLTNLLSNAVKFTHKGYVGIKVRDIEDSAECIVYDTGSGIAKKNLPKVFEKFEQFKRSPGAGEKGTGLGLYIVKGIIEAHGGKIWAESSYGKGTRFTFVLPKR
jgi:PAS domain S-box-containing protein